MPLNFRLTAIRPEVRVGSEETVHIQVQQVETAETAATAVEAAVVQAEMPMEFTQKVLFFHKPIPVLAAEQPAKAVLEDSVPADQPMAAMGQTAVLLMSIRSRYLFINSILRFSTKVGWETGRKVAPL